MKALASKRDYVKRRISGWEMSDVSRLLAHRGERLGHERAVPGRLRPVVDLARRIYDDYPTDALRGALANLGPHGVNGGLTYLIFAADGPKPRIVLTDAVNDTIYVVRNAEHCPIYDEPLTADGLTWRQLAYVVGPAPRASEK